MVVAVLTLLIVAAVGLVVRSRESETASVLQSGDDPDAADAVPSRSGPLRFEASDSPPTNEVYRAWHALAEEVGARRTATPREIRDAAKAAGYDAEGVEELTALFRTVRYGDVPAADSPERRAAQLASALSIGAS